MKSVKTIKASLGNQKAWTTKPINSTYLQKREEKSTVTSPICRKWLPTTLSVQLLSPSACWSVQQLWKVCRIIIA